MAGVSSSEWEPGLPGERTKAAQAELSAKTSTALPMRVVGTTDAKRAMSENGKIGERSGGRLGGGSDVAGDCIRHAGRDARRAKWVRIVFRVAAVGLFALHVRGKAGSRAQCVAVWTLN